MSLDGRVAIVTGGRRGIGAAISTELAREGAAVAVADLDADDAAKTAAQIVAETGRSALGVGVDVTNAASIARTVAQVTDELGVVDILVNNAGVDRIGRFVDSDEKTWDLLIGTNLKGTIAFTRAVLDPMLERESGRIINIASDAAKVGSSGEVVYSATKGGVLSFTKALARETATKGVTVNCVCPGPTDTALLDQVAEVNQKLYDSLARAVPMRRIGRPEDIAPMVAFLAGDSAAFITGQGISVSGGLTMS